MLAISLIYQGLVGGVSHDVHGATLSSATSIRASARNAFLAAKTDATIASVSAVDEDFGFIDKFDRLNSLSYENA